MNLLLVAQLACSLRVYFQTRAVEHRMGFTQDGNRKRPLIGPTKFETVSRLVRLCA